MPDKIVRFDKYHNIKKYLPGFGSPAFANAYAEARAFVHAAEGKFLSRAQLTHLATRMSPFALCILHEFVKRLQHSRRSADVQR